MPNEGICGRVCHGSASSTNGVDVVVIDDIVPQETVRTDERTAVTAWLEEHSLSQYTDLLFQNGFDEMDTLLHAEERDLEQLNVSVGHRRKFMVQLHRTKESLRDKSFRSEAIERSEQSKASMIQADDHLQDQLGSIEDLHTDEETDDGEFWRRIYEASQLPKTPPTNLSKDHSSRTAGVSVSKSTSFLRTTLKDLDQSETASERMEILQDYDTTHARMKHVFSLYDHDKDGLIDKNELMKGPAVKLNFDLSSIDEETASSIIRHCLGHKPRIGTASDDKVDLKLFSSLVKRLRLARLFAHDADEIFATGREPTRLLVCDYASGGISRMECIMQDYELELTNAQAHSSRSCTSTNTNIPKACTQHKMTEEYAINFFFKSRKPPNGHGRIRSDACYDDLQRHDAHWKENSSRWIHLDASSGLDHLTVLRLAVKYSLHPLAIDDLIDNRTPTKLDKFGEGQYIFVSLDIATLENQGEEAPSKPPRVRVTRSNVSVLLHKGHNSILTILQNRPDKSSWMAKWWQAEEDHLGDDSSDVTSGKEDWSLWEKLRLELQHEPARRVRENKAKFLLFTILEKVANQLRPIAEAYANRLGHMHQCKLQRFGSEWLMELDELQIELVDLARLIRPMKQVMHHLIEEKDITAEEKMYLEDVVDAIDQFLGDLDQLKVMGRTMEEAYEAFSDRRMNATLFNLSVFGAIFLPAQFITGLYGMNFVKADGTPGIPELLWENGYEFFWLLEVGFISIGLLVWAISYALNSAGISKREILRKYCCPKKKKR